MNCKKIGFRKILELKKNKKQYADYVHSLSWKNNSYRLFKSSKSKKECEEAFLWCGVNGNVQRTVESEDQKDFLDYVYNNLNEIESGTFDLSTVRKFGSKVPTSWASKICHIINPWCYPLIYDDLTKDEFKISSPKEFWEFIKENRTRFKNMCRRKIYRYDSYYWAKKK